MTAIRIDNFAGMSLLASPRLLNTNQAQYANNVYVNDGDLVPFKSAAQDYALAKSGTIRTIYRFDGQYWFQWTQNVNVVRGPVPGDTTERTYYTGDGVPQYTYASIATQGSSGEYPTNGYQLGIPAPADTPSVSVSGTPTDPNSIAESRAYVYTFVSALEEEGPPSPPSALVDIRDGQTATVSNISGPPNGNYEISYVKLYRSNTSDAGTFYQLVKQINVGTGSTTDTLLATALGADLPSTDWYPPPADMQGLIALPNGILCGFTGTTLCFSEAYLPHAWPPRYQLTTNAPIVAIAAFGSSVVVGTDDYPVVANGTTPASISLEKLEESYACVSARGMVDMGYTVVYPSPLGLVTASSSGVDIATKGILSFEAWQALKPSSIHAYRWKHCYLGFYDTGTLQGGFLLDPTGSKLTYLDFYATAGYTDPATGTLYLVSNSNILRWNEGSGVLTQTWRSKEFVTPNRLNFGCARISADAYPVHLRVLADSTVKFDADIEDDSVFMLPAGFMASKWVFEPSGKHTVRTLEVAEAPWEIRAT